MVNKRIANDRRTSVRRGLFDRVALSRDIVLRERVVPMSRGWARWAETACPWLP